MNETGTLTVELSPEATRLVEDAVRAGAYPDVGAAVEAAILGLSPEPDDLFGYAPEELDRLIDEGIASGPGREIDFDAIKREARRRAGAQKTGA